MSQERSDEIQRLLTEAFSPTELLVKDQSRLHVGHAGAKEGKGHFEVIIVTDAFHGRSRIERHRMVFDALGTFMETDIHALSIQAYALDERK